MGRTFALIFGAAAPFFGCGDPAATAAPAPGLAGESTPTTAGQVEPTQKPETAPKPGPPANLGQLPPRIAIGGIRTIDCASTVVYAAAPEVPHRLNATYAFPDRARWWLGVGDESSPERQMRLRYGDLVYAVDQQGAASREMLAEARTECIVQLEMRRALLLWPHGFEWKRTGNESSASLNGVGRLTAHFSDELGKNPITLSFTAMDGKPGDELRAIAWREEQGKAWPTKLELWHAGELVWTETVRTIDTRIRYIDSYFLPPDRRDAGSSRPVEIGAVRGTDLPECRVRRVPLEPDLTLDAALEQWTRVVRESGAKIEARGFALDDKVTLEITRTARPAAILLRLAPTRLPLPEELAREFELVRERPALSTFVMGIHNVAQSQVQSLEANLPGDAAAGVPYLRFDPKKPDQHVLIVLPLAAR